MTAGGWMHIGSQGFVHGTYSTIMAEMAIHCFAGIASRGMSMVSLNNCSGVDIEKAVNGGFGLVLDGSYHPDRIIRYAMPRDVTVDVARRARARNKHAVKTGIAFNLDFPDQNHITIPFIPEKSMIEKRVSDRFHA
jgi:urocanate hydratase